MITQKLNNQVWRMVCAVLLSMAILMSPHAYAADGAQEPITTDSIMNASKLSNEDGISGISLLQFIFGPVVHDPLNPSSAKGSTKDKNPIVAEDKETNQLLSGIFGVINLSLLALGTLYLSYSMVAGVAQTANDGEFLGKRFSTLWIPTRIGIGIVGLIPAFSGWSIAQLVIIWASVMGVGIGNLATGKVISVLRDGGTVTVNAMPEAGRELAFEVFKMNLCMEAINKEASPAMAMSISSRTESIVYRYGEGRCGEVRMPIASKYGAGYYGNAKQAFEAMNSALAQYAKVLVDSVYNEESDRYVYNPSDISLAGNNFSDKLRSFSREPKEKLEADKVAQRLETQGFAGLGAYFTSISSSGMNAGRLGELMPTATKAAPDPDDVPSGIRDVYEKSVLLTLSRDTSDKNTSVSSASKDGNAVIKLLANFGDECSIFAQGLGGMMKNADSCFGTTSNMLLKTTKIGDAIVGIGIPASIAVIGIKGATEGAANSFMGKVVDILPLTAAGKKAALAILNYGVDMAVSLLTILLFFGGMLSYYLPLLPYIAWLGAMISWVTVVIEGVIAAPLWAFAHLDTDGEGMGQKAQYGYMFLLQVLLRPALMVVGFVFSLIVMEVIGGFFYKTYPLALGDSGVISGWGAIIGLVIAVAVFFTTSVMIVNLSTNLIHFIPNVALQWLGSHATESGTAGREASGNFTAASAGAIAAGKNVVGEAMKKLYKRVEDRKTNDARNQKTNDDDKRPGVRTTEAAKTTIG